MKIIGRSAQTSIQEVNGNDARVEIDLGERWEFH
jgi:hypothetical protein